VSNSTDAATLDDVHKLKCLHCGKSFTATRSDAKFDTTTCRVAYHRKEKGMGQIRNKKVRRRCEQCGKSYWTSQPDRSRFDTDTCRAQWHHQHRNQKA